MGGRRCYPAVHPCESALQLEIITKSSDCMRFCRVEFFPDSVAVMGRRWNGTNRIKLLLLTKGRRNDQQPTYYRSDEDVRMAIMKPNNK
ncbi:hypothetical protein Trydic_g20040 [Trypoxylus dichotomus]